MNDSGSNYHGNKSIEGFSQASNLRGKEKDQKSESNTFSNPRGIQLTVVPSSGANRNKNPNLVHGLMGGRSPKLKVGSPRFEYQGAKTTKTAIKK